MYEMFQSFAEYIRDNELQRAEGLLLRYLAEVYKALVQTVPAYAKTEEVYGMEDYHSRRDGQNGVELLSLLDEWEKLRQPGLRQRREPGAREWCAAHDVRHHAEPQGLHGARPQRGFPRGSGARLP